MSATVGTLAPMLARELRIPENTVRGYAQASRELKLLPQGKRGRGAPKLDTSDVVTLIVGLASDPSVKKVRETIEGTRAAAAVKSDSTLADALEISKAKNVGEALERLLDALRAGACVRFHVDFIDCGHAVEITLTPPGRARPVVHAFAQSEPPNTHRTALTRINRVDGSLFAEIADLMGPAEA